MSVGEQIGRRDSAPTVNRGVAVESRATPRGVVASLSGAGIRLARKKLVRRAAADHSQHYRRALQFAFLLLNLWLGAAFYFWVRQLETGTDKRITFRPAGVEGWLPIAGLMNFDKIKG